MRRGSEGVEPAVVDLVESVRLKKDNAAALRLLAECYEMKKMNDEALKVCLDLVKVEPESVYARDALVRLGSDSM